MGVVSIKGVWLWVLFYPELPVSEIWFLKLAGVLLEGKFAGRNTGTHTAQSTVLLHTPLFSRLCTYYVSTPNLEVIAIPTTHCVWYQ